MTDKDIKIKGYKILIKEMGLQDAEKFISLVTKEPGDYTKFRENLFNDKTLKDLSADAMKYRKQG